MGQPIDLNTGYDLNTPRGQKKVRKILQEQKPRIVFMAPECTAWSIFQNMNDQKVVDDKRKKQMPMVKFCADVASYQVAQGRYFIMENPSTSRLWNVPCIQGVSRKCGVSWGDLDMCRYSMRDPVSGLLFKKSLSLMHNLPEDLMQPIFKECTNHQHKQHHQHQMVEGGCKGHGSRTKLSQVYTTVFCTALIQVFFDLFHGVRGKNISCLQSNCVRTV